MADRIPTDIERPRGDETAAPPRAGDAPRSEKRARRSGRLPVIAPAEDDAPAMSDVRAEAYEAAAAGPGGVVSSLRYAWKTSGLARGARAMLDVNQNGGFDCPGCAWPDPEHRSTFEF